MTARLRASTHPRLYLAQLSAAEAATLGEAPAVDDVLRHYARHGAARGLRLCALFTPEVYRARAGASGLDGARLFLHWIVDGWERRIVPTELFDHDWYAARHPRLHADLDRAGRWSFEHYLAEGCYDPTWMPSPLGRHHPGGDPARDPEGGDPLLLRELLHRAAEYDLRRTSWLEEGQRRGLARLAVLDSPRMRDLIAKATALEPAVTHTRATPFITVPPYRTRRLYLAEQAEVVRRAVGVTHVDEIVLVAGAGDPVPGDAVARSRLVVATDRPREDAPAGAFDLAVHSEGLTPEHRVDLLVDVLRGLTPRRVVLAGSATGRAALASYGRQLSALFEVVTG